MTRLTSTPFIPFAFAVLCAAQTTPTPAPLSPPLAPAYTIKSGTQLVVVDVLVKDKHGNKIHNLKGVDFILKENGQPQDLKDFDEHVALTPEQLAKVPARPNLPPGEFTNFAATPPNGALNVLLVDRLNTAPKDQMFMLDELKRFLKTARPDARTAIYGLNDHLTLLQGFSSDPAVLLAAMNRKGKAEISPFRDDVSGGVPTSAANSDLGAILTSNFGSALGIAGFEAPIQSYQADVRSFETLDALNDLARALAAIPGRKNLIWFAGDFPQNFFPTDNGNNGPYNHTAAVEDEYRDTINLLSRAQVAVYPIDPQGLRTDHANDASQANAQFAAKDRAGVNELAAHTSEFALTSGEHLGMSQIAHDTGGEAYYNSNDLSRLVSNAMDDGSSYYTLVYSPTTERSKDGYRSISVAVAGEKYELSYRRGYYTDKAHHLATAAAPVASGAPSSLLQALKPGSPLPAQVLMRAKAYPVSTEEQPEVLPGNQANPDPKLPHGPYRVYEIDVAASAREMSFAHAGDNLYHADIDIVSSVFDVNGTLITTQSNTVRATYPQDKLIALLRGSGIQFSQRISVPVKGEYFLRLAVRDKTSDHAGAIEVPVAAIAQLSPPPVPLPAPADAKPVSPLSQP